MQVLIPVFAILNAATALQLTPLPYAYLANPFPVYHQSQDTRAGVHAYSYSGGPSAKEEVRDLDGVTRGSYSYIDAHGVLQSVFYVADEGGFRVAATNLPTDDNLPFKTSQVLLTRYTRSREHAKVATGRKEERTVSRRKRSLEAPPVDQDRRQTENSSSQGDQTNQNPVIASPKSSHELPKQEEKSDEGRVNRGIADSVVTPIYGLLNSILIPRLTDVSHQSRVDVRNNVHLKTAQPVETIGALSEPMILPNQVPLATSHQNRLQVHNNLRVEVPEELVNVKTETVAVKLQPLVSVLPDNHKNRIQLHNDLGLEGSNRKDAVKIDTAQLAIVETPISPVRAVPVITKEAIPVVAKETVPVVTVLPIANKELPVVSAISSQNRIQIHGNVKPVPIANEPIAYLTFYARPITTWPILAPIAQSFQYRHQTHLNEKLELAK